MSRSPRPPPPFAPRLPQDPAPACWVLMAVIQDGCHHGRPLQSRGAGSRRAGVPAAESFAPRAAHRAMEQMFAGIPEGGVGGRWPQALWEQDPCGPVTPGQRPVPATGAPRGMRTAGPVLPLNLQGKPPPPRLEGGSPWALEQAVNPGPSCAGTQALVPACVSGRGHHTAS